MTIYIIILGIFFLIALLDNKNQQSRTSYRFHHAFSHKYSITPIFSISIIYLLMALKAPIYGDYYAYSINFKNAAYKTIAEMARKKGEHGFHAFTKVITYITDNPSWYFAITSAIICISLYLFVKKHAYNKNYAIYFYYTIGLFAFTLAGLRQAIAMSICLFAYQAIKEKKLIRFLIIVSIAFLFHKSAILFIPAYPIAWFKWKKSSFIILITIYGFLFVSFNTLYYKIAGWLNYDNYGIENAKNGGIFFIILIIISALCLNCRKKLLEKDSRNIIYINLHFAVLALWVFRLVTRTVERPAFYYLYSSVILLDQILSIQFESYAEEDSRKFLLISSLFLFGLLFIYRLIRDPNLIPYVFI